VKLPHRRQFLHLAVGAAALPVASRFARAQAYPVRPITVIVPFEPLDILDGVPLADVLCVVVDVAILL
jgi:hypothetical protein